VGGKVASNRQSLAGLRMLSQGLDDTFRAADMVANRQKQQDTLLGQKAQAEGESYEDQKTRGMQEGYLKAKGRNAALGVTNDLHALYDRGEVQLPDGTTFNWKKGQRSWEDASAEFLKNRLQGIDKTEDSMYFLEGLQPLVESTISSLSTTATREASEEWAMARHTDLIGGFSSAFQMLREVQPEWAPSKLPNETPEEYSVRSAEAWKGVAATEWKKVRGELIANYVSTGGALRDVNDIELKALNDAVMSAANAGDDDTVKRLLSIGSVKRGDLKLSLAESGYGADLVSMEHSAIVRMNALDRKRDTQDKDKDKGEQTNSYTSLSLAISEAKTPEDLAKVQAEWDTLSLEEKQLKYGKYAPSLSNLLSGQAESFDKKDQEAAAKDYHLLVSQGTIKGLKDRILSDARLDPLEASRLLARIENQENEPLPVPMSHSLLQAAREKYNAHVAETYKAQDPSVRANFATKYDNEVAVALKERANELKGMTPDKQDAAIAGILKNILSAKGVKEGATIKTAAEVVSNTKKQAKPEMTLEELQEIPGWRDELTDQILSSSARRVFVEYQDKTLGTRAYHKKHFDSALYNKLEPGVRAQINDTIQLRAFRERSEKWRKLAASWFPLFTPDPTAASNDVRFIGPVEGDTKIQRSLLPEELGTSWFTPFTPPTYVRLRKE